jgi:hypothetical protein
MVTSRYSTSPSTVKSTLEVEAIDVMVTSLTVPPRATSTLAHRANIDVIESLPGA